MRGGQRAKNINSIKLRMSAKEKPVQTRKMSEEEWRNRKRRKS